MTRDLTKWFAFTLAEVLVTLAIIGVVAALTIPALLANTSEKGLNTSDSVFQRRLGEALKVMNLQGTLAGHQTTQAFVDELGRHMKITKTCPSSKLSECFVSEFQKDNENSEPINVTDLQSSVNLNKGGNYGSETIGVVFGNGTRALIAYNKNATQDQFNNSNEEGSPVRLTVPNKKLDKQAEVKLETEALSILYNLQERKNNNVYGENIKGINVTFNIIKCVDGATQYGGTCYIVAPGWISWSDAKTFCEGKDMSLIPNPSGSSTGKLATLMKDPDFKTALGISSLDQWFWSASEAGGGNIWHVNSSSGAVTACWNSVGRRGICAGN